MTEACASNKHNNISPAVGDVSLHELYMLVGELKYTRRTGWLIHKVGKEQSPQQSEESLKSECTLSEVPLASHNSRTSHSVDCVESVADHMYRMSIMALTLPLSNHEDSKDLNRDKLVKLTIVHDVAEAIVGDLIVGRDGLTKEKKHQLEQEAISKMKSMLVNGNSEETAENFHDLWREYENQSSPEAKLAKDLDRYDMILQALDYEMKDRVPRKLQQFFDSTEGCFKFACVQNLVKVLYDKRNNFIESFSCDR